MGLRGRNGLRGRKSLRGRKGLRGRNGLRGRKSLRGRNGLGGRDGFANRDLCLQLESLLCLDKLVHISVAKTRSFPQHRRYLNLAIRRRVQLIEWLVERQSGFQWVVRKVYGVAGIGIITFLSH